MPRFKDQAICVREIDWSETSQVVGLLTEQHGKVRGIAKGSKRTSPSSTQRFSGGIELLTLGQVVANTNPSADLATLTEWDLQNDHFGLRRNLPAQQKAMYAADLSSAMLADDDPHPRTFHALRLFLETLTESEDPDTDTTLALLRFQWQVLDDCGYNPRLDTNLRNRSVLGDEATYSFDPGSGGLTSESQPNDWRVRRQTVVILRAIQNGESIDSNQNKSIMRANRLLCCYARYILDRELPTMKIILEPPR